MSRLDDELRIAFRREQPPADFAARVLARLDEPLPQKKPGFLSALVSFLEAPQLRWAALGAAAMLVAIVLLWQLAPRPQTIDTKPVVATTDPAPDARSTKDENKVASEAEKPKDRQIINAGGESIKKDEKEKNGRRAVPVKYRRQVVARQVAPKVDPEAEAAKQQVLLALQLASNTFNDAQRAIQSDSHKPNTERNR